MLVPVCVTALSFSLFACPIYSFRPRQIQAAVQGRSINCVQSMSTGSPYVCVCNFNENSIIIKGELIYILIINPITSEWGIMLRNRYIYLYAVNGWGRFSQYLIELMHHPVLSVIFSISASSGLTLVRIKNALQHQPTITPERCL